MNEVVQLKYQAGCGYPADRAVRLRWLPAHPRRTDGIVARPRVEDDPV